jgi:hypothetical protein
MRNAITAGIEATSKGLTSDLHATSMRPDGHFCQHFSSTFPGGKMTLFRMENSEVALSRKWGSNGSAALEPLLVQNQYPVDSKVACGAGPQVCWSSKALVVPGLYQPTVLVTGTRTQESPELRAAGQGTRAQVGSKTQRVLSSCPFHFTFCCPLSDEDGAVPNPHFVCLTCQ